MDKKNVDTKDENSLLFDCIEKNQTKAFLDAVKLRENITGIRDQFGNTLLMSFASAMTVASTASLAENVKKNESVIKTLLGLDSWKSVIDTKNRFQKTALIKAAEKQYATPIVALLLEAGARVDIRGANNFPAVVHAAWQKADANVALLMEHGKSIYLKDAEAKKFWTQVLKAAWANNFKVTNGLLSGSINDWDVREFLAQQLAKRTPDAENFALYVDSLNVAVVEKPAQENVTTVTPKTVDTPVKPNGQIRVQG